MRKRCSILMGEGIMTVSGNARMRLTTSAEVFCIALLCRRAALCRRAHAETRREKC